MGKKTKTLPSGDTLPAVAKKKPVERSKPSIQNEWGCTLKEETYCREYIRDFNASRAARVAGFGKAHGSFSVLSSRLMKQEHIRARIKMLKDELNEGIMFDIQDARRKMITAISRAIPDFGDTDASEKKAKESTMFYEGIAALDKLIKLCEKDWGLDKRVPEPPAGVNVNVGIANIEVKSISMAQQMEALGMSVDQVKRVNAIFAEAATTKIIDVTPTS